MRIKCLRYFLILIMTTLLFTLAGCAANTTTSVEQTVPSELSGFNLEKLLGKDKQTVIDSLNFDSQKDFTVNEDLSSDAILVLTANHPFTYESKNAKVEFYFVNNIFFRFSYIFEDEAETGYHYAKELRNEFVDLYGEPDTYSGVSDRMDNSTSFEEFKSSSLGQLHEEWALKEDEDLAKKIFGDQKASMWQNQIWLKCSVQSLIDTSHFTAIVVVEYTPPTHGRPIQ